RACTPLWRTLSVSATLRRNTRANASCAMRAAWRWVSASTRAASRSGGRMVSGAFIGNGSGDVACPQRGGGGFGWPHHADPKAQQHAAQRMSVLDREAALEISEDQPRARQPVARRIVDRAPGCLGRVGLVLGEPEHRLAFAQTVQLGARK